MWLPLVSWSAIPVEGQDNVDIGGCFLEVNAEMSQISAHPLVWAESKVQRLWALFARLRYVYKHVKWARLLVHMYCYYSGESTARQPLINMLTPTHFSCLPLLLLSSPDTLALLRVGADTFLCSLTLTSLPFRSDELIARVRCLAVRSCFQSKATTCQWSSSSMQNGARGSKKETGREEEEERRGKRGERAREEGEWERSGKGQGRREEWKRGREKGKREARRRGDKIIVYMWPAMWNTSASHNLKDKKNTRKKNSFTDTAQELYSEIQNDWPTAVIFTKKLPSALHFPLTENKFFQGVPVFVFPAVFHILKEKGDMATLIKGTWADYDTLTFYQYKYGRAWSSFYCLDH